MIQRFRLSYILVTLFLLSSMTSAWPWPPSLKDIGMEGLLVRRQDNTQSATSLASDTATDKTTSTLSKTASPASTAKSAKATSDASKTDSASGSAKPSQTDDSSSSAAATTGKAAVTSVNPVLPPGSANLITPSAIAQQTYYKIGDQITFAWNYTGLSITPSKIDVLVSCSANSATYTLSNNASFAKTGTAVWDTVPDETGTAPLLTETYTLIIYDAAQAVTAVAGAGELGVSDKFQFGMYLPQKYTSVQNGWKCAVCSAAISDTERQALKFMLGMSLVTVLSFTWFVSGIF